MTFNPNDIWNYKYELYTAFYRVRKRGSFDSDDIIQELWLQLRHKTLEFTDKNHLVRFLIKAGKYILFSKFSTKIRSSYFEQNGVEITPEGVFSEEEFVLDNNFDYVVSEELLNYPDYEFRSDIPIFDKLVDREISRFCIKNKLYKSLNSPVGIKIDKPILKTILKRDIQGDLTGWNVFGELKPTKKLFRKNQKEYVIKKFRNEFKASINYQNIITIYKQII